MTNLDIADLIYDRVSGTCHDTISVIDQMIEEGEFSREQFLANEMEILGSVDDRMFNCEICGWNFETSEMSWQEMICENCAEDEEDES